MKADHGMTEPGIFASRRALLAGLAATSALTVAGCASTDATRYVLNGVLFSPEKGGTLAATNGRLLAVAPVRHGQGIGSALMTEALRRLRATCRGAALVGDPGYYARFGFRTFPGLKVTGCPPEVVQAVPFDGSEPAGELNHHPAFGVIQPTE